MKALFGAALFLGGAAGIGVLPGFVADPAALTIAMGLGRGSELMGVTLLLWRAADELMRHRADPASALGLASPR